MGLIHGVAAGVALGAAYEMSKRETKNPNRVTERITNIFADGTKEIVEFKASGKRTSRIVKLNALEKVRYQGGEKIKEKVDDFQEGAKQFIDDKLEDLQAFTGSMSEKVRGLFSSNEEEGLPEEAQEELQDIVENASSETMELDVEMDGVMPESLSDIGFEDGPDDPDNNEEI